MRAEDLHLVPDPTQGRRPVVTRGGLYPHISAHQDLLSTNLGHSHRDLQDDSTEPVPSAYFVYALVKHDE